MSQRAHNRRHEGRAIRKQRREDAEVMALAMDAMPGMYQAFQEMHRIFLEEIVPVLLQAKKAFENLALAAMGWPLPDPAEPHRADYVLIEGAEKPSQLEN